MSEYIELPITTDVEQLQDDAIDYLKAQTDDQWTPSPGNLEVWMIEAAARMAAELAYVAAEVPSSIFRYFGKQVFGVQPIDAMPAMADTTWSLSNTDSERTIAAGTYIVIDEVAFEVAEDVVVPQGVAATAPGEVPIVAVEPGAHGNSLSTPVELVDALAWVQSISVVGQTSGGQDAETDEDYLNRLTEELQLMTPRPIVPRDFEALARGRISAVERAVAIDGYNPADQTTNNERMVTVVAIDDAGQPISSAAKTELDDLLQSLREVNFVVHVADPTYTTINVTTAVTSYPTWDAASVKANVEAALADFLSPATWGRPPYADDRTWLNTPLVRYLEVAEAIQRAAGVDHINSLSVNGGTADITMPGVAPLPTAGTLSVTAK